MNVFPVKCLNLAAIVETLGLDVAKLGRSEAERPQHPSTSTSDADRHGFC